MQPPHEGPPRAPTEPHEEEAARWVARRRDGLDAAGRQALQAWLDADPRHLRAFAELQDTFVRVAALPAGGVARLRAGMAPHGPARPSRRLGRRLGAALALAALGLGWTAWDRWSMQPRFDQHYATQRGEQLAVTLPDAAGGGSRVRLDSATRLDVRLHRDRRELRLHEGRASFAVHHDPARPLHVRAGPLDVLVTGTRFSVRHTREGLDAGRVIVEVEQGRVRVSSEAGSGKAAAVELRAGQMLGTDAAGVPGPVRPLVAAAATAWREGRIAFDGVPLAQALAEFERYGPTGVVVRDPAVGALPVGGSWRVGDARRFAETLPELLPVRLELRDGVIELVARPSPAGHAT
ncbi:FecR family protein [Rubrivivax gelatinosus]|uniref:FecR family protein n=1 Tax=Rubrivivax gelatinosus TaxID=28068 RepID=A0A4R2MJ79_RUBGE|nr:FecR domain-containing protein [Rubrivivax gelatinosus]MBK1687593.1 iron dicitrate transport regulator FecR [Rubrivivax gelatinosus]TCP02966.1 FecR family protein [Rubrivivax gelatinosus]